MKLFSLMLAAGSLLAVSCERHEFEGPQGTKQLNESHAKHGESAGHGDQEKPAEHPEKAAH
jgi:hypothetical protein